MPNPLMCPPEFLALDLSNRVYIITGANSGVGLATAAQLAKQGAHIIMACRNLGEGERAKAAIAVASRGTLEVCALDLASLDSVRTFVAAFVASGRPLHGLVNNAGVMNTPATKTRDGFELQFGVNHLGHFLLTEGLLEVLKLSAPSRIINISSCYHDVARGRPGRIDFDDPHFERRKYDGWAAYAQSKLANVLYAQQLARRLKGTGVSVASVHPGWVRTRLVRSFMPLWVQDMASPLLRWGGMLEPWEGAQVPLFALLSPRVAEHSGEFYSQLGIFRDKAANSGGLPLISPNPEVHNPTNAERLDRLSRTLVGIG